MRSRSLLTLFLIVFVDLVGFGIVLPNLALYGQEFGITSLFTLVLLGAVYSLCQFVFSPLLGAWSDRLGRRPILILSQMGTVLGFALMYAAHWYTGDYRMWGIGLLFGARILDGLSGGNISVASAYIADITTPENRAKGMGVIGAAFGLGFIFGPAIGAFTATHWGLAMVPLVGGGFSALALTLTCLFLAESRPAEARVVRGLWIHHFSFVRSHTALRHLVLVGFIQVFAFAGMEQTYSLLVQERYYPTTIAHELLQGRNVLESAARTSGYLFAIMGVTMAIMQGGLVGRLVKLAGELALVLVGGLIIAAGLLALSVVTSWSGFVAASVALAVGSALWSPCLNALLSRHAGSEQQGAVMGVYQGFASLARALGPLFAGLVATQISLPWSYAVIGLIVLLSVGLVMLWRPALALSPSADPPAGK